MAIVPARHYICRDISRSEQSDLLISSLGGYHCLGEGDWKVKALEVSGLDHRVLVMYVDSDEMVTATGRRGELLQRLSNLPALPPILLGAGKEQRTQKGL